MVSHNQDPYELSTLKHWYIIHHIHGLKYELLHKFLYYTRVHRSWSAQSCKIHSGSVTEDNTRHHKSLHHAQKCGVLDRSSELEPPADFSALQWVAIGAHELATTPVVLRHFCNQQIQKQDLSNQSSARLTCQRDHKQPTPSMQGFMGRLYTNAKPAL
jgi:hypothetical protein